MKALNCSNVFIALQSVMEGYNGTILAYGQTGSGKTHTLLGPPRPPVAATASGASSAITGGSSVSAAPSSSASLLSASGLLHVGSSPQPATEGIAFGSFGPSSKGFGVRPISRGGPSVAPSASLYASPGGISVNRDAAVLQATSTSGDDDDQVPAVLCRSDGAYDERGIIPRAIEQIFEDIARDDSHAYTVFASYVQIYCELVHDLLSEDPAARSLSIREDADGSVYVEGVTKVRVSSVSEGLDYLAQGHLNRAVARTKCVLCLRVVLVLP